MKPIYQDKKYNCLQAATASLLELKLEMVPHFILYEEWWDVFVGFLGLIGYDVIGMGKPSEYSLTPNTPTINGAILAIVKSTRKWNHAVLINSNGVVIHDPNKTKRFLGVDVLRSGQLIEWQIIVKR